MIDQLTTFAESPLGIDIGLVTLFAVIAWLAFKDSLRGKVK